MPPKSSAPAPQQQEPMNLEELCGILLNPLAPGEAKAQTIQTLCTVAHHPKVKSDLIQRPDVLRSLATSVMQRTEAFYRVRWSTLAVVGELCRLEATGDSQNATDRNKLAKDFVVVFATLPWFRGGLKDITVEDDDGDEQQREIASDLLDVFPEEREALANPAVGEEQLAPGLVWTKKQKDKAVDLMYIDPTEPEQLKVLPFVVRASNRECGNCRAKAEKALSRCTVCKAAFYCSQQCQVQAWKVAHKHVCNAWKAKDPTAFPVLFYETRAYCYAQRPETLKDVDYYDYFMKYSPTYRQ